ncbi:MAG: phage protease [Sodalis sp. (in: enterobacteria)]|uniref:phage protease n=1 Tax=Sodalis sp. (in: enterobacteria) TaxID=1898979 RepID=UPI003F33388C
MPHWRLEEPQARRLIDAAPARQTPYCFDYEHQAIHARAPGIAPAPAAGWYSQLEWVEGLGLFAVDVEWTERARTLIAAGEYRFVSPLFQYDRQGNVTCLVNAALSQQTSTLPDPAAYAPVSVVNELGEQVAALGRQLSGNEVTALLTAALSDGRLSRLWPQRRDHCQHDKR